MQFLYWLAQIGIALLVSGGTAVVLGVSYVIVAGLVFATCAMLLFDHAHRRSLILDEPVPLSEVGGILASSLAFSTIWPVLPLVLALKTFSDDDEPAGKAR